MAGAPYAKYKNGIIVFWNEKWVFFLTSEDRSAETDSLATVSPPEQDVELVDLGCCSKNIVVRDSAVIGISSKTHVKNDFIMTINSGRHTYSSTDTIKNNSASLLAFLPPISYTIK